MKEFKLDNHEYIELNKLLKITGLVESGGRANVVISIGEVKLNGNTETQKRKKLRINDVVEFMGEQIKIV